MNTSSVEMRRTAKNALAIVGALSLIIQGGAQLLRATGGPEVVTEISSPKGGYKAVHAVYLGSAIAPHCIDVLSVYRIDDGVGGTDESSRVYFGSCHSDAPAIRWLSENALQVRFSMAGALENIAELRLKPHAVDGQVKVSFVVAQ